MDLQKQVDLRQANIEKLFAAAVYSYPLYTLQECGWLDHSILVNDIVSEFWRLVKERVDINMSDERAGEIVTEIAMQSGAYLELTEWSRDLSAAPMPRAYANEISRRYFINLVMRRLGDITGAIAIGDEQNLKNILKALVETEIAGGSTIPKAIEIAEKFNALIDSGNHSVMTFIPPIDAALAGLERKTLLVLAARPSMGKTALALQIARNVGESRTKTNFFSCEMSAIALWARMACPLAGTTWLDVRAGKADLAKLQQVKEQSLHLAERFGDSLSIIDGIQTSETIWRTCAQSKPDLVVIDHLRFLKDKVGDNENKRLGIITERLHDMSKALNVPILLLAQLNRKLEERQDKRPQLPDLRDSGEIEENADTILMMYRESYYNDEPPQEKDPVEVWVRKFRDGEANHRINLVYDARAEWFEPANKTYLEYRP